MSSTALYETYKRAPLSFIDGEGAWLVASDGSRYLDFSSGVAVNALGHRHPHLVETLQRCADGVWHVSNLYEIDEQTRLAERLCEVTFADKVFFVNSGAEALETAIKTTRRYFWSKGEPQRNRIITFEGAFHGRTLGTISAGGQAAYMEGFSPNVDGFDQVPFGDHEALHAAITDQTAGILIEPIQGEGGVRPVPPQCMRGLRELCDKHGILLILDEVQSGVGRTGHMFAHQGAGIEPDVMAIAKGIGGGFPLGASLATAEVASGMVQGTHGNTFGGNPLACSVGNAVLDVVLEDGFLEDVQRKSLVLKQKLAGLIDCNSDIFESVRGEGFLLGLKCRVPNGEVVQAMRDQQMLCVPAGDNVMRLLPPLVVSDEDIQEALVRLERACTSLRA